MGFFSLLQYTLFVLVIAVLVKPVGGYLARVFSGEKTAPDFVLLPVERGFTEILYAYTSCLANNGQNLAGLNANTPFYNVTTALAMMIGRFGLAIPALALAALFAKQRRRPVTVGTLPTDTFSFAVLVVGAAIIVGGLSYYAALCLGPIVEHFTMIG